MLRVRVESADQEHSESEFKGAGAVRWIQNDEQR